MAKSHRSFEDVEVDVHVGGRVRVRRTLLGMNQTQLGESLGVTFQQVQKYENGANRISASRLYQIGRVLDVPVPYFFEDLPESGKAVQRRPTGSKAPPTKQDPMIRSETLKLVRAYYRIEDADVRQCLRDTVRALANEGRRRHA